MPKIYDLTAPAGTYKDPNTGQDKTRWHRCGALVEKANGKRSVVIESLPIGFDGWLECVTPKPKESAAPKPKDDGVPFDDSLPF